MTLSTDIYVLGPLDPMVAFREAQRLVGATEDTPFANSKWGEEGAQWLHNLAGQGFPAWLSIFYRPGGPLMDEEEAEARRLRDHQEFCSAGGCICPSDSPQPSYLTINFDTAYSYSDDVGRGCTQIHADYIISLGAWLDVQGIPWKWQNEFTGETHEGYGGLLDFVGNGAEAGEWFSNVVKPLIERLTQMEEWD